MALYKAKLLSVSNREAVLDLLDGEEPMRVTLGHLVSIPALRYYEGQAIMFCVGLKGELCGYCPAEAWTSTVPEDTSGVSHDVGQ